MDTLAMENEKLKSVFRRAFRCETGPSNFSVRDLKEWDSLTHIKLVMELESTFEITIGPEDIPMLYSDFDTIAKYISSRGAGG